MKQITYLKMLSISLSASIILTNSIQLRAASNASELDFNNNGIVDTQDLSLLANNYNFKSDYVNWNSKCDLNLDNVVDIFDLVKVSKAIGTTTSTISDNTNITDAFTDTSFKTIVYNLIGKTSPDPILYSDVKNITILDVHYKNLTSLSGIEYFTALTELICYSNRLKTLDLSKNTALTDLFCNNNQLTTLDLNNNTSLIYLSCYLNQLTTLDLSKNTELANLNCQSNQLSTLDISENKSLTYLACCFNQLTTLFSIKNTWDNSSYKTQYTDSTYSTTNTDLVITIRD